MTWKPFMQFLFLFFLIALVCFFFFFFLWACWICLMPYCPVTNHNSEGFFALPLNVVACVESLPWYAGPSVCLFWAWQCWYCLLVLSCFAYCLPNDEEILRAFCVALECFSWMVWKFLNVWSICLDIFGLGLEMDRFWAYAGYGLGFMVYVVGHGFQQVWQGILVF